MVCQIAKLLQFLSAPASSFQYIDSTIAQFIIIAIPLIVFYHVYQFVIIKLIQNIAIVHTNLFTVSNRLLLPLSQKQMFNIFYTTLSGQGKRSIPIVVLNIQIGIIL